MLPRLGSKVLLPSHMSLAAFCFSFSPCLHRVIGSASTAQLLSRSQICTFQASTHSLAILDTIHKTTKMLSFQDALPVHLLSATMHWQYITEKSPLYRGGVCSFANLAALIWPTFLHLMLVLVGLHHRLFRPQSALLSRYLLHDDLHTFVLSICLCCSCQPSAAYAHQV